MPDDSLDGTVAPIEPNRTQDVSYSAPAEALTATRAAARIVAARALTDRGFVAHSTPDEHWTGTLDLPRSHTSVPVTVLLPPSFPDALPKVRVPPDKFAKRVAHVELTGNVCVAPTGNILIDADRPNDLVEQTLTRAAEIIDRGLAGETDADLDAEFHGYWLPTDFSVLLSLCEADGPARSVAVCELTGGSRLIERSQMLADRIEDAEAWAERVGATVALHGQGVFIPVSATISLPLREQSTTISQIAQLVLLHSPRPAQQLFRSVIARGDYPQIVVLSMPEAPVGSGRRLAAIRIEQPARSFFKKAQRGFRPGRVPPERILSLIGSLPVERLNLKRVDASYLVTRGGAATELLQATATVVGVGAVGSEVARNLAAIGVGHIRLVDPDEMALENVHRHALGMHSTGYPKALALMVELRRSFPHLDVQAHVVNAQELLTSQPAFLLEADVIVLATGEETLERRLNRVLQGGPPRVHTWLEPLGIGGHGFACGMAAGIGRRNAAPVRGCFECLYRVDDVVGLINRTALTAPGQEIRQSVGGCAGTFSPFSALDARRTAIDAAELTARVLTRQITSALLVSWRGLHTLFEAAGHKLSRRASQVPPGGRSEVAGSDLVQNDCPVCSHRPSTYARHGSPLASQ